MSGIGQETLIQTSDFCNPTVLDVFAHEKIFDANGFPYLSFSPTDYHVDGPQMELGAFTTDDVTSRKENGGIVNTVERRNAQEYFGDAMQTLRVIRSAYVQVVTDTDEPLTNSDVLKIAHMGIELPRYLVWNQYTEYRNGELPPESILLSKALRGFHALVTGMSWGVPSSQEHRQDFLQKPFSAQETLDFILEKNSLENDLVCAGHWSMIAGMVGIIEGEDTTRKIGTAAVGFVTSNLLDFSKSLRTFWDVVYPSLEAGIKAVEHLELKGVSRTEQEEREAIAPLEHAYTVANMANLLMCKIIGNDEPQTLDLEELLVSLSKYSNQGYQRDRELRRLIADFHG